MDLKNLDEEHGLAVDKWLSGSVAAAALKGDAFLCQCIPEFREAWDATGHGTIDGMLRELSPDRAPDTAMVRAALCLWGSGEITAAYIDPVDRAVALRQDIDTIGWAILNGTITLDMIQAEIQHRIGGYYDDQE